MLWEYVACVSRYFHKVNPQVCIANQTGFKTPKEGVADYMAAPSFVIFDAEI